MGNFLDSVFRKHGIFFQNSGLRTRGPIIAEGGLVGTMGIGNVYYLDPANGSDSRNGKSPDQAFLTLAYAYSKLTADQNDILFLIGGASGATISDTLTWAKDYTHLIGLCAPGINRRARITTTGTDSAVAGLVVSASGCIFANFRISQETSLAAIGNIEVTGARNYFSDVDIQMPIGTLALASATAYALKLNGAEECRFERCVIGIDTVVRTATQILLIDGDAKRIEFVDCDFVSASETAANVMVKINDTSALDRYLKFKGECVFSNFSVNHVVTLTQAFSIPASCQTSDIIIGSLCNLVGIAEWDADDRAGTWIGAPTGAAATQGIAVKPAT